MAAILSGSIIFLLDVVIKKQAELSLAPYRSIPLIKNVFHLTLVHNTGAALGLFQGNNKLFAVISFASVIICAYLFLRYGQKDFLSRLFSGAILGGALSNLYDRLSTGYVVDYLDFRIWPVFNLSDACITIGFAVLVWRSLFHRSQVQNTDNRKQKTDFRGQRAEVRKQR